MKTYTIPEHYDTAGIITAQSDPNTEFAIWQKLAAENPLEWDGDEFTLADFEAWIANLATP